MPTRWPLVHRTWASVGAPQPAALTGILAGTAIEQPRVAKLAQAGGGDRFGETSAPGELLEAVRAVAGFAERAPGAAGVIQSR